MFFDSTTFQGIVFGLAVGLAAYFILRKRWRLPPGPFALPLVGNLLSLRNDSLYHKADEWSQQYGPIITIYLGPIRCVFLNRIDVVLEALVKKNEDFAGRLQTFSGTQVSEGGKNIIFGIYGPAWKLHRKLASKALRYYLSGSQLEEKVTASVSKVIELMKKEKGPFDPHQYMSLLTFNILCGVCFNENHDLGDPEFTQIMTLLDDLHAKIGNGFFEDIIPPLRFCPTPRFRQCVGIMETFANYVQERIDEHRKTLSEDNMRDFTDAFLLAQHEAKEDNDPALLAQITDTHIRQAISDIFGAGQNTTRGILDWTLLYLAVHQDIQAKIHKEVDSALDPGQLPLISDRDRLPYTNATICESLRLGMVVPFGLPHTTICDTSLGEYEIPKGTLVMINHWALHHDPEQWENVNEFKPERFLDEDGKMAPKPESWLPFSAGRRVCLGETMAKPELHLILAGLMRNFKVSLPPDTQPNFSPKTTGFDYTPNPYQIVIDERK